MSAQYIKLPVGCSRAHPWILKTDSKTAAVQGMFIYLITHANTARRRLDSHQACQQDCSSRDLVLIWALPALPVPANSGRVETEGNRREEMVLGCKTRIEQSALPFPGQTGSPQLVGASLALFEEALGPSCSGEAIYSFAQWLVLWAGSLIFMRVPGVKQLHNLRLAHQLQGSTNTIK